MGQRYQAGTKAINQSKIMQIADRLPENVSNDIKTLISRTLQLVRTVILDMVNGSYLLNVIAPSDP